MQRIRFTEQIKYIQQRKKYFSPCFLLNSLVPSVVYIIFCLRKQKLMAFCEKSSMKTDILSVVRNNVLLCVKNVFYV